MVSVSKLDYSVIQFSEQKLRSKNKMRLKNHDRRRRVPLKCPVCGVLIAPDIDIVRVNRGQYAHVKCLEKYRQDIPDELSDDEELETFFAIAE